MPKLNVRRRQPVAAFWYMTLPALASVLLLFVLILLLAATLSEALIPALLLFALIVSGIMLTPSVLYYFLFTYEVHEHSITVNSGILFRQYEAIDFGKIQTIDNERNPILMLFGLTRVEIWTASWDQFTPRADGKQIRPRPDTKMLLAKNDAATLRDFVMHAKSSTRPE